MLQVLKVYACFSILEITIDQSEIIGTLLLVENTCCPFYKQTGFLNLLKTQSIVSIIQMIDFYVTWKKIQ